MIFNLFMNNVRKMSIRGRFSIALRGCELLAEKKNLSSGATLSDFFPVAWEYTSTDDLSEWEASVGEDYERDFGDNELTHIIHRTLDLGNYHFYGSIDNEGEIQIAYALWDILDILHRHDIVLMDTKKVQAFSPFRSIRYLLSWDRFPWGGFGYGLPFTRNEIVPLMGYATNCGIHSLIDMRPYKY